MSTSTARETISTKIPYSVPKPNAEINHQYTLKIVIESIIWFKSMPSSHITISFCDPLVRKFYTLPEPIQVKADESVYLENIQCRLNLEVPSTNVMEIFTKWSPAIFISNSKNEILSHYELDLSEFKFKKSTEKVFRLVPLYDSVYSDIKIAEISLILTIYDNKINVNSADFAYVVPTLFKLSDQLEKWKDAQKLVFKEKEEKRINELEDKWKRDKDHMQSTLTKNIEDTQKMLEKLKAERDSVKKVVEMYRNKPKLEDCEPIRKNKELKDRYLQTNKKNIKEPIKPKIEKPSNLSQINQQPNKPLKGILITNENSKLAKDNREFRELSVTIKKQTEEIRILQKKCGNLKDIQKLNEQVEMLRYQNGMKDKEIANLREHWAKATRKLNTFQRREMAIAKQARKVGLPVIIQEFLQTDRSEIQQDLEQLRSIKKELTEQTKQEQKEETEDEFESDNEINILLKTGTYSRNDKLIKLLAQKEKENFKFSGRTKK